MYLKLIIYSSVTMLQFKKSALLLKSIIYPVLLQNVSSVQVEIPQSMLRKEARKISQISVRKMNFLGLNIALTRCRIRILEDRSKLRVLKIVTCVCFFSTTCLGACLFQLSQGRKRLGHFLFTMYV